MKCARCSMPFVPRKGGRPQRYCSPQCAWRAQNGVRYQRSRLSILRRMRENTYGMSVGEYAAMVDRQGGRCAICRQPETSRRDGRLRDLSIDHDHTTGLIRGLLCNRCNRALGGFNDSPDLLRAAADYLARRERRVA